jgi:hypothetical protein
MVENMKGETGSWKLMAKCLDLDPKGSHKWVLVVLCYHYPNIFPSEARIAKEGAQESRLRGAENHRKDAHPHGMCVIEIL